MWQFSAWPTNISVTSAGWVAGVTAAASWAKSELFSWIFLGIFIISWQSFGHTRFVPNCTESWLRGDVGMTALLWNRCGRAAACLGTRPGRAMAGRLYGVTRFFELPSEMFPNLFQCTALQPLSRRGGGDENLLENVWRWRGAVLLHLPFPQWVSACGSAQEETVKCSAKGTFCSWSARSELHICIDLLCCRHQSLHTAFSRRKIKALGEWKG